MNQSASITITKTVTINGNSTTSVISVNCAPSEVNGETQRILDTMRGTTTGNL